MKHIPKYPIQSDAVDALIDSSLYRCSHSDIPTFSQKLPEVSTEAKAACRTHISGHTILIRESSPLYYGRLDEVLSTNKALLFYVWPNFDVYGSSGNQELKAELKNINFRFGANIAEDVIGTNAAVLCSRTSQGCWCIGRQHYAECLHPYAFYGFTVNGRYDRAVHILLAIRKKDLTPDVISLFRLIEATESVYCSGRLTEDVFMKNDFVQKRYSEEKSENILIILGKNNHITYVNDIFYRLFETTYNDIINYPLETVLPELRYITEELSAGSLPNVRKVVFARLGSTEYIISCSDINKTTGGCVITAQRALGTKVHKTNANNGTKYDLDDLIGVSDEFIGQKKFAERVAMTDCTVLIRGESGTGKELFAQAIHNASNRSDKPFVSINCAAIPRDLIGSELFGYVGGAFTGANRTGAKGKFELADGGTLFLDEIGEMPPDMQSVLLRVLEDRSVTRIGGSKPIPVDVRLIAATNQNLEEYIKLGKFRLDLFYRLNVISLKTIPLRGRQNDIEALSDHFLVNLSQRYNKVCNGITLEARRALRAYSWPGNVRELRNVIERGFITTDSEFIELHHLPSEIRNGNYCMEQEAPPPAPAGVVASTPETGKDLISGYRREAVAQLMKEFDGNKSKVAKKMGIARTTLYRILKEME